MKNQSTLKHVTVIWIRSYACTSAPVVTASMPPSHVPVRCRRRCRHVGSICWRNGISTSRLRVLYCRLWPPSLLYGPLNSFFKEVNSHLEDDRWKLKVFSHCLTVISCYIFNVKSWRKIVENFQITGINITIECFRSCSDSDSCIYLSSKKRMYSFSAVFR